MPLRFVSVEMETPFQGRTERWSNVFCYDMGTVSVAAHEAIQDAVVNAMKPVHGTMVKFVRSRVYTTEGLNVGDDGTMFSIMERNTFGTAPAAGVGMYRECAVLVKWPLPRKTKPLGGLGRQRSLKKWIHCCNAAWITNDEINGSAQLTTNTKGEFATFAAAVRTPGTGNKLVSPSDGAEPSDTAIIHPYLEHRQFPRGRKEGVL